jgi:hypothetical protein
MNYFIPYCVGASQSDIRAIKGGWYAMDDDGKLFSGPFPSREQCIERNAGPADEAMPPPGRFESQARRTDPPLYPRRDVKCGFPYWPS